MTKQKKEKKEKKEPHRNGQGIESRLKTD